jgi:BirA family biotin operon repressor/biotin-[acetyl-CoA-carboxylase] ligase
VAEILEYDRVAVSDLARATTAAQVLAYDVVDSTMNVAHTLAIDGAPHGTAIVAEEQTAGRGRERRQWRSSRDGVWLTVIARALDPEQLDALPIRVGLEVARALDAFAPDRVGLKWPNDLYVSAGKLGGILVEARWRQDALEWAAIGVGINVLAPAGVGAASLRTSVRRAAVLKAVVPAVLTAAARTGELSAEELSEFAGRDIASGREILEPLAGTVRGVAPSGALLVEAAGVVQEVRTGSLVFRASPFSLSANS